MIDDPRIADIVGVVAGDVLKVPDSCRFESGGLGGWFLFKKDSFSCLFSYS
jgi:hypothetical protein